MDTLFRIAIIILIFGIPLALQLLIERYDRKNPTSDDEIKFWKENDHESGYYD